MEVLKIADYRSSQLDDYDVVRRVIAGEKALFEILLRRYNQTLYRVVRSYLKDQDEVKDAMQDTYLKAFDKLSQFQGNSAFSTWLIRIGINEALQRLRKIKKERQIYIDSPEIGLGAFHQIPDKQMNPEKIIIRQEAQQLLEQAIDSLPEKYRVIYMLREVEGLNNSQITECLNLTESNMKVRLHRAKSLLKEKLLAMSTPAQVFEFGNTRCDAVVTFVMNSI
jgi:RNA polymerase sigma factor (sigma-70 family)